MVPESSGAPTITSRDTVAKLEWTGQEPRHKRRLRTGSSPVLGRRFWRFRRDAPLLRDRATPRAMDHQLRFDQNVALLCKLLAAYGPRGRRLGAVSTSDLADICRRHGSIAKCPNRPQLSLGQPLRAWPVDPSGHLPSLWCGTGGMDLKELRGPQPLNFPIGSRGASKSSR